MTEYDTKVADLAKDLSKGTAVKKIKAKYSEKFLEDAGLEDMRRNWSYMNRGTNLALLEQSVRMSSSDATAGLEGILTTVEGMNPSKRIKSYDSVSKGLQMLKTSLDTYLDESLGETAELDVNYSGEVDVDDEEFARTLEEFRRKEPWVDEEAASPPKDEDVAILPEENYAWFDERDDPAGTTIETPAYQPEVIPPWELEADVNVIEFPETEAIIAQKKMRVEINEEVSRIFNKFYETRDASELESTLSLVDNRVESGIADTSFVGDYITALEENVDKASVHRFFGRAGWFERRRQRKALNKVQNIVDQYSNKWSNYQSVEDLETIAKLPERRINWNPEVPRWVAAAGIVVTAGAISLLATSDITKGGSTVLETLAYYQLQAASQLHEIGDRSINAQEIPLEYYYMDKDLGEIIAEPIDETVPPLDPLIQEALESIPNEVLAEHVPQVKSQKPKKLFGAAPIPKSDFPLVIDIEGNPMPASTSLQQAMATGLPTWTDSNDCPLPNAWIPRPDGAYECGNLPTSTGSYSIIESFRDVNDTALADTDEIIIEDTA